MIPEMNNCLSSNSQETSVSLVSINSEERLQIELAMLLQGGENCVISSLMFLLSPQNSLEILIR